VAEQPGIAVVHVRLPLVKKEELAAAAAARGLKPSPYVRQLIYRHLQQLNANLPSTTTLAG
jgi:hypothetical protein